MSVLAAILTSLATVIILGIVWRKVAVDEVGEFEKDLTGFGVQGRVAKWLKDTAPLRAPRPPSKPRKKGRPDPESPAGRALAALIREEMVLHALAPDAAHKRLLARAPSPISRAFLDGRMRRAVVFHAMNQYRGPQALFWPWFLFIAGIRYGRRRLYLDTVTSAVREMRA